MNQPISWTNLGFKYLDTGSYVSADFKNGRWSRPAVRHGDHLSIHIAATCIHYGQACFEGLKAFRTKDGRVVCFRPDAHAARLALSAARLCMAPPPRELFIDAIQALVEANAAYVPPYGPRASFYVRPLLLGTSPVIGVHESEEYVFIVLGMPVGPYYKSGLVPVSAWVQETYDRAAANGVGHIKAAGNYAAGMLGDKEMRRHGHEVSLYLDSATHTFIDEFGTSNFIGITADGRYVTPASKSILASVTNDSLQQIAADFGLIVERRPIRWDEIKHFTEVGACGTAAVITPISSITRGTDVVRFGDEAEAGPTLTRLFRAIQAIQYGEQEDRYGWVQTMLA